jgi:hypothetical protein
MATLQLIASVILLGGVVITPVLAIDRLGSPIPKVVKTRTVGVPGPVVGASIPAVALVGGYVWLVRRKRQRKDQASAK